MTPQRIAELRKKAEEIISQTPAEKLPAPDSHQETLQELRINRIELELQNEELRDAQQRLEQSRSRYVDLFQNAPVGYLIVDRVGLIRQFNQTFCRMLNLQPEKVTGQPLAALFTADYENAFRSRLGVLVKSDQVKTMDVVFTAGDYQKKEALLTIQSRSVLDSQDERELFISVTDITKQKDDEKRIQTLLEEKEVFLKEIHHRMKNNMNSIISLISIEMALYPDLESTRILQDIIGRIQSMSHLYNRLLETELYDKVDFSLYMEGLIEQIRRVYPYQGTISVTTRFDDFTIDPQRVFPLGLIVNELYCNAVKHAFTDGRDGSIQFEASYNDGTVTFRYKDSGVGFTTDPKENQESFGYTLFDMMSRKLKGQWTTAGDEGVSHTLVFPAF